MRVDLRPSPCMPSPMVDGDASRPRMQVCSFASVDHTTNKEEHFGAF